MRKTRSLLAIRNPTEWAQSFSGSSHQRRPNLIYSCIYRSRRTPVPQHNPFGHPDVPDANHVRAVPDLPKHPKPLGPYSHCVVANGFVFISAQAPIAPGAKAGEWAAPDVAGQTRQSLKNIASILEELGLTMASVVKTTGFLTNPARDTSPVRWPCGVGRRLPRPPRRLPGCSSGSGHLPSRGRQALGSSAPPLSPG